MVDPMMEFMMGSGDTILGNPFQHLSKLVCMLRGYPPHGQGSHHALPQASSPKGDGLGLPLGWPSKLGLSTKCSRPSGALVCHQPCLNPQT
jgi:hypothetical protein